MRPVSGRWAEAITTSQTIAVEVRSMQSGELLPLTAGSVTLDITAAVRGRCDLTFNDPTLIPVDSDSELAPYANELAVSRGIVHSDGERELVPLGIFGIQETEWDDEPDGVTIKVTAHDRSQRVIDAIYEEAATIAGGTDYLTAIRSGISVVFPSVIFDFAERTLATPLLRIEEGQDRWAFYQDMATALGMDLYFDNAGPCVLRPIPEPAGNPVAAIVEGRDGVEVRPSLLKVSKKLTRVDAHNRWIVTGENPDTEGAPPRAVATDDDPDSPTNYFGDFGPKPDRYSSPFISTTAQAQDAAQGRKAKEMGISGSVNFGALVNPALEPTDIVRVTRTRENPLDPENRIPVVDEDHIIDTLTIPLVAADSMTANTRATKVTS